jgi:hypothetical protein
VKAAASGFHNRWPSPHPDAANDKSGSIRFGWSRIDPGASRVKSESRAMLQVFVVASPIAENRCPLFRAML